MQMVAVGRTATRFRFRELFQAQKIVRHSAHAVMPKAERLASNLRLHPANVTLLPPKGNTLASQWLVETHVPMSACRNWTPRSPTILFLYFTAPGGVYVDHPAYACAGISQL